MTPARKRKDIVRSGSALVGNPPGFRRLYPRIIGVQLFCTYRQGRDSAFNPPGRQGGNKPVLKEHVHVFRRNPCEVSMWDHTLAQGFSRATGWRLKSGPAYTTPRRGASNLCAYDALGGESGVANAHSVPLNEAHWSIRLFMHLPWSVRHSLPQNRFPCGTLDCYKKPVICLPFQSGESLASGRSSLAEQVWPIRGRSIPRIIPAN
jgi:hypothetical protein